MISSEKSYDYYANTLYFIVLIFFSKEKIERNFCAKFSIIHFYAHCKCEYKQFRLSQR